MKRDHVLYWRYKYLFHRAIQYAFFHLPELVELACGVMARPEGGGLSIFDSRYLPHSMDTMPYIILYSALLGSGWALMAFRPSKCTHIRNWRAGGSSISRGVQYHRSTCIRRSHAPGNCSLGGLCF
ncbi:hypothetical protein J3R83DRAFT_2145 [Lanmaoa asiatica]|nr:hypothetical protein J3R83DRAFT_2145 [Lanmaoa asiatica]